MPTFPGFPWNRHHSQGPRCNCILICACQVWQRESDLHHRDDGRASHGGGGRERHLHKPGVRLHRDGRGGRQLPDHCGVHRWANRQFKHQTLFATQWLMGVGQILHFWLGFTIRLRWVWLCVANYVWCWNCPMSSSVPYTCVLPTAQVGHYKPALNSTCGLPWRSISTFSWVKQIWANEQFFPCKWIEQIYYFSLRKGWITLVLCTHWPLNQLQTDVKADCLLRTETILHFYVEFFPTEP